MKVYKSWFAIGLFVTGMILSFGCTKKGTRQAQSMKINQTATVDRAIAVLHPTEGNNISGVVTFTKEGNGIRIVAHIMGLSEGKHGFHIHQFGDCSASDGTSAGGHFNPENVAHGGPDAAIRHVGDLGNIEVGADSVGNYERVDTVITFGGRHSIIGRSVVVHANEDDLTSQPTGNAGPRVACGVIGIASEMKQ